MTYRWMRAAVMKKSLLGFLFISEAMLFVSFLAVPLPVAAASRTGYHAGAHAMKRSEEHAVHPFSPAVYFSATCENINISQDGYLSADCRRLDGSLKHSTLGLNPFIGNDNGYLHSPGEGFTRTCSDLHMTDAFLFATCRTNDGNEHGSPGLDLDLHVANLDGNLEWSHS